MNDGLRPGGAPTAQPGTEPTVTELCARFLVQHEASPARIDVLCSMLRLVDAAFGEARPSALTAEQLAAWRATLAPPSRWQATQALKQVTAWATLWRMIERDPLAGLPNPRPRAREHRPLATWDEIERLADALPQSLALLPWLGAGCGLRPGELFALDWSAVDLERRELHVRASCWRGELRSGLKTRRSRRSVPIRGRVAERLERAGGGSPQRDGLVFANRGGGPLDLHNVRARAWRPALAAAGLEHPHRIYDLRHTYATWSLRAGVSIFQLARRMGTSVEMIDQTYGHLAADAGEHERRLLDAWDRRSAQCMHRDE